MTRASTPVRALAVLALALAAGACTEKPQTSGTKKADASPYSGVQAQGYVAPGWQAGDKTAWEAALRTRTQAQNEYVRAPAAPK